MPITNPTYITNDQMKQVLLDKFENGTLISITATTMLSIPIKEEDFANYFSFQNFDWEEWLNLGLMPGELCNFTNFTVKFMGTEGDHRGIYWVYTATFI